MNNEPVPQDSPLVSTGTALVPPLVPVELLEDRVQRLEEMVASLVEKEHWDETVQKPLPRLETTTNDNIPRAIPINAAPTASLAEFALPPLAEPSRPSTLGAIFRPVQAALPVASSVMNRVLPASSLWRDLWWDLRTGWRMIRDPYYPMSTACKVFPLFAIFYVTIWPWLSAWSGIIGTIMNYFVNAIVIYIAFKIIQRELRRYYAFVEKYRGPAAHS
ncbi:MAG: hypothetical protein U0796_05145 [Gemmatales bacterium]